MKQRTQRRTRATVIAGCVLAACMLASAQDEAKEAPSSLPPQTALPPGLYLFQTRTRDGTCNDAPRTGYVTSAVATLDGVPGSRTMTLKLLNSKYWPSWTLNVSADNVITGDAFMNGAKDDSAGSSHFELREKKQRFQGIGSRSYNSVEGGKTVRCTLNYDALLKPLD
jgi:hypothetical protein